jgi:hypothetical protein
MKIEETISIYYDVYSSYHALVGTNTPQTLNIEGYIKKKKVTMLIYFGSAHNFIN